MSSEIMMSNRLNLGLPIQEIFRMAYDGKPKLTNLFNYIKATVRYLQAGNKYAGYICQYEIRDKKLIYHIEVSIVPDFIGTNLEMAFEISADRLVITRLYGEKKNNSVIATWQRVS